MLHLAPEVTRDCRATVREVGARFAHVAHAGDHARDRRMVQRELQRGGGDGHAVPRADRFDARARALISGSASW